MIVPRPIAIPVAHCANCERLSDCEALLGLFIMCFVIFIAYFLAFIVTRVK